MSDFVSELAMCRVLVAWLRENGWRVYQEVEVASGSVADVVATHGSVVWIIEAKLRLGFDVLAQACAWRGRAHFVSVAVPIARRTEGREYAWRVSAADGIGVLQVSPSSVSEHARPRLYRRNTAARTLARLVPQQETYAEAGAPTGRRWSAYKSTLQHAVEYIRVHPGCSVRELVESIPHHYGTSATARSVLGRMAQIGEGPEIDARLRSACYRNFPVRASREGRALRLYVVEPVERKEHAA